MKIAHGGVISGIVEDVKLRQCPNPIDGHEIKFEVTAIVWRYGLINGSNENLANTVIRLWVQWAAEEWQWHELR